MEPKSKAVWKSPDGMGPSAEPERKVTEENTAARKWKDFYKKIEMTGESEAWKPEEESDNSIVLIRGGGQTEVWTRLNDLRHKYMVPRMLESVMDQVFYVVEGTRHNLKGDIRCPEWRASVAFEMYQLYTALEEAGRAAREIERSTGFSGEELAAHLSQE